MSTKTLESLELAIAQKALDEYAAAFTDGDAAATEAMAFQRHLQQGIDAFQWIVRAEETLRQAAYQGLIEFSPEIEQSVESLYREWLASSERIEKTFAAGQDCPPDAAEFRAVTSQVRERINALAWVRKSRRFRSGAPMEAS